MAPPVIGWQGCTRFSVLDTSEVLVGKELLVMGGRGSAGKCECTSGFSDPQPPVQGKNKNLHFLTHQHTQPLKVLKPNHQTTNLVKKVTKLCFVVDFGVVHTQSQAAFCDFTQCHPVLTVSSVWINHIGLSEHATSVSHTQIDIRNIPTVPSCYLVSCRCTANSLVHFTMFDFKI